MRGFAVIPAIQEAETGGLQSEVSLGGKNSRLYPKNKLKQKI
jgi:hypothetical protein